MSALTMVERVRAAMQESPLHSFADRVQAYRGDPSIPALVGVPADFDDATWWLAGEVAGMPDHCCFPCYVTPGDARDICRNRLGIERTYVLNPDAFDGPCGATP